jgi:lysophospholipase L1-like esterase
MRGMRTAAAALALGLAAAWGAQAGTRTTTTQAAGRIPSPPAVPSAGAAGGPMGGGGSVPIPVAGRAPQPGIPWFLTIGDSITYGFTRDPSLAGTNITWALRVERMLAAQGRPWRLFDTACPGETTLTYAARCPGRRSLPLLAHQSQRTAALDAIAADGGWLRLIVVALGSNDLLHDLTGDPATIQAELVTHLQAILTELRAAAPAVPILVADIYDPFAVGAPHTDEVLTPIDDAVAALAARLGDGFADVHAAFNHPGDGAPLCSLIDCADLDIHPTALGQQRLAEAVMRAIPPVPPPR